MLEDLIKERLKKLEALKKAGYDPYPARVTRTHQISEVLKSFPSLAKAKKKVSVTGRVMGLRKQGGLLFADLKDESGQIQLVIKKDNLKNFSILAENLDIGDFAEAGGTLFKTKKGERSIEVKTLRIITKSLRPLPSKWYGLEETETRLRKRYLDLIAHPELKELFHKKTLFWEAIRDFMKSEDFLEVETPVLEAVPGGADAEPFITHHNALDVDFYLRISLEIALKKLMVAGYEKVFEIGRIFRNEGIDAEHLQDYTQLEFYWAYHDYNDLMTLVERLYKEVIKKTFGTLTTSWQGKKINWGKKWPRVEYVQVFRELTKINPLEASRDLLFKKAIAFGIKPDTKLGKGRLIDLIFKKVVRPTFIQPIFLINPPVELKPLTKRLESNPKLAECLHPMAGGTELGTGFSELNDPTDQRERFREQMKLREAGDKEAQRMDEDFLEALEYGMPPTAGFGVSERLFAVLVDKPVREVVFFPLMRPRGK